jgi:RHS repeat-associated protein
MQYFPSGEPWVDQQSNTERLPHLFSSKELDQETGLYYFGARYYDPRVGLWASADPASTEYLDGEVGIGGVYHPVNLATFAYAGHNPQKYTDPDGRAINLVAGGIGFAVGGLLGGGVELGRQLWRGEDVNWNRVGATAAGGAVAGGLAGLTAGGSLLAQGAMAGASSAVGGTVTRTALGEQTTGTNLVVDATVGVVTFGIVKGTSSALQHARTPTVGSAGTGPAKKALCFAAGTDILTPSGSIKIEDVQVDQLVLAYDFASQKVVARKVMGLQHGETQLWILIRTEDGAEIRATRFHPFWVENLGRWVDAMDLQAGWVLRTSSGNLLRVASVQVHHLERPEQTFNFEVEELHNYFAGEQGVLVHNDTSPPPILGIQHANKSAYESAKAIQLEQAKLARGLVPNGVRIDIPSGDPTKPGNYPHAHGKGWSVNIDGSLHDAHSNKNAIPDKVKDALRKAGWGC